MKTKKYTAETKQRAMDLVIEAQKDHSSLWSAIQSVAPKIGCTPESLRRWHQQHLDKKNPTVVTAQSQTARIAELEREVKQLEQINEILRKATAFSPRRNSTVHANNGQIHRRRASYLRGRVNL